jgi:hypothetical protein
LGNLYGELGGVVVVMVPTPIIKLWALPETVGGVVHANVGQKVLNRNIFSNFTYFLRCPATEICTPLLADATDSVIN